MRGQGLFLHGLRSLLAGLTKEKRPGFMRLLQMSDKLRCTNSHRSRAYWPHISALLRGA